MLPRIRQVVDDDARGGQRAVRLDICHQHLLVGGDVQLALAMSEAVGELQILRHDLLLIGHAIAVRVAQQEHIALIAPAHVHIAIGHGLQPAHIGHVLRKNGDLEAWRYLQLREHGLVELGG
ncbi:hypothetical protein D3C71_1810590 [compost metagenome]